MSGKSRERFECDCDTALAEDVGGVRCEVDLAPPTMSCGTSLPVELNDTYIADYSFLLNFTHYGAFCAQSSGDYFPTAWTGDDSNEADCSGATTTEWMVDNVGLQAASITPTNPVDVCDDAAFVAASTAHAAFCSSGAGA